MAGLDFVLFAGFAWAIDVRGWQRPVRPFVILGMNAIAVYMVSELLETQLRVMRLRDAIYLRAFAPLATPINASLLYALAYTSLMFVVAWVLYRRQWFIKI
jgi:predicted acyltransferase